MSDGEEFCDGCYKKFPLKEVFSWCYSLSIYTAYFCRGCFKEHTGWEVEDIYPEEADVAQ